MPVPDAPAAHDPSFLTLDTHIDIPWPDRGDARAERSERRFDLRKAKRGGLDAACLVAYIPQGKRDEAGDAEAWARVQAMLDAIASLAGDADGLPARLCRKAAAVRAAHEAGAFAIIPAVENGHALGGRAERVGELARRYGIRYMTLTHNGHNALADAAVPLPALGDGPALHGGLSALGREVIREMNRHGVIVDVSHAAKSTMLQATEISETPVIASHSCARGLADHPRNLDDEQLDRLKETGGLVQVTAMGRFLREDGKAGVDDLARHVAYIAGRIGVDHVGLSSDFDGGGGIAGWRDASETAGVTRALEAAGFSATEIAAIWGGNALRLLALAERKAGPA